jgi:predicted phage gp36 major capsid-like protein
VTRLASTTASRVAATTNASFGAVDIYALAKALPARHQENAKWLAAYQWEYDVRQFATGTANQHAFWADFGQGTPPELLGHQWNGCTGMQAPPLSAATASSDDILILGDFREYLIVDQAGQLRGPQRHGAGRQPPPDRHDRLGLLLEDRCRRHQRQRLPHVALLDRGSVAGPLERAARHCL